MTFEVNDITSAIYTIAEHARQNNVSLDSLQITRPSLEDVYLSLIGYDTEQAAEPEAKAARGGRSRRRNR